MDATEGHETAVAALEMTTCTVKALMPQTVHLSSKAIAQDMGLAAGADGHAVTLRMSARRILTGLHPLPGCGWTILWQGTHSQSTFSGLE